MSFINWAVYRALICNYIRIDYGMQLLLSEILLQRIIPGSLFTVNCGLVTCLKLWNIKINSYLAGKPAHTGKSDGMNWKQIFDLYSSVETLLRTKDTHINSIEYWIMYTVIETGILFTMLHLITNWLWYPFYTGFHVKFSDQHAFPLFNTIGFTHPRDQGYVFSLYYKIDCYCYYLKINICLCRF